MPDTDLSQQIEAIAGGIQDAERLEGTDGVAIVRVPSSKITGLADAMRGLGFDTLHCLTGVDYPDRIEIVYHLFRSTDQAAVVMKAVCERDNARVDSLVSIWVTADWHERETAELYGVTFTGHPNPERLLLAEDFPGYPLRKDWAYADLERYLLQ